MASFYIRLVAAFVVVSSMVDAQTTNCPLTRLSTVLSSGRLQSRLAPHPAVAAHNERIVGGSETTPNQYPWMAHLEIKFWSGDTATCGGILISERWVMSAAHCFYGGVNITIVLGAHDISGSRPNTQTYLVRARDVINYPDWFFGDVENDIALIKLPQDVLLSNTIQPARLPYSDDPDQVGDPVTLLGWGNYSSTPDSGLSSVLRQVGSTVISSAGTNGQCQQLSGVGPFSGDKIICADGSQGNRYCYGDDGGPMADYREDEQQWFAIGVAWTGDATVECQSSGKPNIYARVSHYVDWIYNKTGIPPVSRPTTTTPTTTTTTETTTTTTTTPTTTTMRTTTTEDPFFNCKGKDNGLYPYPGVDCTKYFFYCSNEIAYLYDCPVAGTIFDYSKCYCEFPSMVEGCTDYVPEP